MVLKKKKRNEKRREEKREAAVIIPFMGSFVYHGGMGNGVRLRQGAQGRAQRIYILTRGELVY